VHDKWLARRPSTTILLSKTSQAVSIVSSDHFLTYLYDFAIDDYLQQFLASLYEYSLVTRFQTVDLNSKQLRLPLLFLVDYCAAYFCLFCNNLAADFVSDQVSYRALYTVSGKKGATLFLPVTLQNANRFSKFFYHHTLQ